MTTPLTDAALWTELHTDPLALGYASRTDVPVETLLNAKSYSSVLSVMAREPFIYLISDMLFRVNSLPDTNSSKAPLIALYTAQSALMGVVSNVIINSAAMQATFGLLIASGVTTQLEITALTSIPASRAEILWGVGTYVSYLDIGRVRVQNAGVI